MHKTIQYYATQKRDKCHRFSVYAPRVPVCVHAYAHAKAPRVLLEYVLLRVIRTPCLWVRSLLVFDFRVIRWYLMVHL